MLHDADGLIAAFVSLSVCSFCAYRGRGGLKLTAALIALSFFALGSLPFLEGYTLFDLFGKVTLAGGPLQEAAALLFRILAWASFANLALALIGSQRIDPHGGHWGDADATAWALLTLRALLNASPPLRLTP